MQKFSFPRSECDVRGRAILAAQSSGFVTELGPSESVGLNGSGSGFG
jgi:hypothetical protein